MPDKEEQEKPLAAGAYHHINIEQTNAFSGEGKAHHRRNCIKCGGCAAAIILITVTVILVLMLTIFHVKDPVLKINSLNFKGLNSSANFGPGGYNLTVEADVSVKNPNVASFKFVNATTKLYYNGSIIGETTSPSGHVRARRTLQTEVLIVVDKMMEVGGLKGRSILRINLCMRIYGNVKITNGIKKSFVLSTDCTMNVNVSSHGIQDWNC
ncbi:hypothetical protein CDL12_28221 [Handroanthus impetiginosus]|uniref:Late embryogenesis abundant protein LEA-2 subgroup domain-containing protein n=1 Tax=Handroanthus impetiginosus TaxID=429701 RepID=A0A2G9G1X1_9LAMI|nr:hypothetical protein CDL12_28221 [Handroanthus impetiginosus]